jgi:hypothetical protein
MIQWTEELMQLALTSHPGSKFYCRRWVAVPNVSWGLCSVLQTGREVDLLCVTQSRMVHAVEIKISESDLIADKKKRWRLLGKPGNVSREWFAVPEPLQAAAAEHAPANAGIILVTEGTGQIRWAKTTVARKPVCNHVARKLSDSEMIQLMRLGVMRMWSKRSVQSARKQAE